MQFIKKKFDELTTNELYEILQVRNKVFVVEQECYYQDCDGKDEEAIHFLAINKNKIIGYLRILPKELAYEEVAIGRVLVIKEYRGKKIAVKLMTEAISYISNVLGEDEIRISAQLYLKKFYEELGFEQASEEYLEDNIKHMEMFYSKKII